MNIYIIGFMGAGKSVIGNLLSTKNSRQFLDTDKEISRLNNLEINQIFKNKGEKYFRLEERKLLTKIKFQTQLIVSTGGGFSCFNNNIKALNNSGITIYLKHSIDSLFNRLIEFKSERPLIKKIADDKLCSFIIKELKSREKYYLQAKIVIECDNKSNEDILREVNTSIFAK